VNPDQVDRLGLLGNVKSSTVTISLAVVDSYVSLPYSESDWNDMLIELCSGRLEITLTDGTAWSFEDGDVFWLAGLPVAVVRNPGSEVAMLATVSRNVTR
jgi:hypothetical protein